MKILWTYLQPYRWWLLSALSLAGVAQILFLYDPIIFGKIIEQGTREKLGDKKGLYYAMWRQQIGERETPGNGVSAEEEEEESNLKG